MEADVFNNAHLDDEGNFYEDPDEALFNRPMLTQPSHENEDPCLVELRGIRARVSFSGLKSFYTRH